MTPWTAAREHADVKDIKPLARIDTDVRPMDVGARGEGESWKDRLYKGEGQW